MTLPSVNLVLFIAVFPETRTALRTYHPVPALQKSDGHLQDAPRIKNMLKAVSYPGGVEEPATPAECIQYRVCVYICAENVFGSLGLHHGTGTCDQP